MPNDHALLFLPDISGFTRFVEGTDIDHGQHIISELIELLINEDKLGLTVAEVEGDAVFFYSDGPPPTVDALLEQCHRMFVRFHQHLRRYSSHRICDCGACSTAERLTLKFVAHAGEIRLITVGGRSKPFGAEVIMAHRLLKNKVAGHEYILLTDAFVQGLPIPLNNGITQAAEGLEEYEDLPAVRYQVLNISKLHDHVEDAVEAGAQLPKAETPILRSITIDAPPTTVYRALTDLERRGEWDPVATRIERSDHHINRPGSRHTCVLPIGQVELETVSGGRAGNGFEYVERTLKVPFISTAYTRYMIAPEGTGSRLESTTHLVPGSIMGRLILGMAQRRMGKWQTQALQHLKILVEKEGSRPDHGTTSINEKVTNTLTTP